MNRTGRGTPSAPRVIGIMTVIGVLAAVRASAAAPTAPEDCSAIADDYKRPACYHPKLGKPAGGGRQPIPAAAAPAAAQVNPEADSGLNESAKAAREPDNDKPQYPDSITGTVRGGGRVQADK